VLLLLLLAVRMLVLLVEVSPLELQQPAAPLRQQVQQQALQGHPLDQAGAQQHQQQVAEQPPPSSSSSSHAPACPLRPSDASC
jgi:hypothetical protein